MERASRMICGYCSQEQVYHYTKITFVHLSVCLSVCDGKLPTFTGYPVDPEAFSPSHSRLEAASGTLWKAAT